MFGIPTPSRELQLQCNVRILFLAYLILVTGTATALPAESWWLQSTPGVAMEVFRQESLSTPYTPQQRQQQRRILERTPDSAFVYYDNPQLHWKIRLEAPATLDQGNAIVPSPYDDNLLYVTTSSGNLFVLSAVDGKTLWTYSPPEKSLHNGDEVWTTTCGSSVVFGNVDSVGKFLVYAVVDYPPGGTVYGPQRYVSYLVLNSANAVLLFVNSSFAFDSRLIAISIPDHEPLWLSTDLPGVVQGTPVVNTNQNDPTRQFILISRNSQLLKNDNTTQTTGHVTMLQSDTGQVVWTESEGMRAGASNPQGYGPLAICMSPVFGNYDGGKDNTNDLVVWTSSGREGRSKNGFTYAFQLPSFYHGSSEQINALASVQLKAEACNEPREADFVGLKALKDDCSVLP